MIALLSLVSLTVALASSDNVVILPDGTRLQGTPTANGVTAFKGVPYAAPPVGELRFSPPKRWSNPNTHLIVDATEYGSPCKQHYFDGNEIGSEDCLYLNVWVNLNQSTDNSNSGSLPVAVYIHGGSYMSGMGNDIEGSDFVSYWQGNVIVVSMNYRLNVFGFSGSDALRAQDRESGSTGNYGLQDQRLAMKWVNENIAAFGGNADQVMIYGESAGAGSVTNHLVMPRSMPFYSSAILESGSFADWVTQPLSVAQTAYDTLLEKVDCTDVDCLLRLPTEVVYKASRSIFSTDITYGTPYNPTVDGVELTTHPWISATNGDVADVPVLQGSNLDEGSMFLPLSYNCSKVELVAYWSMFLSMEDIETTMDLYVTGDDIPVYPPLTVDGIEVSQYWWAGNRAMADGSFYCCAKYSSMQFSQQMKDGSRKSRTYNYHFDYLADGSDVPFVQHTNEIPFMLHDESYMSSVADQKMTDVVAGYWGAFLSRHDPNINNNPSHPTDTFPEWDAYDNENDNLLLMEGPGNIEEVSSVNKAQCDFFIPWLNEKLNKMFPAPFNYP